METVNGFKLERIKHDINGNPRYVIHFLAIAQDYARAVKLANTIGGRKYHNKQYGGGIVFQGYGADDIGPHILKISETVPVTVTVSSAVSENDNAGNAKAKAKGE